MSRSKHFAFTNFDVDKKPEEFLPKFTHLIYQLEKCPETQRLHHQGNVSFPYQRTVSSLVKQWKGPHYEICRHVGKARNYCKKSPTSVEGPFEFGSTLAVKPAELETQTKLADLHPKYKRYIDACKLANPADYDIYGCEVTEEEFLNDYADKYIHIDDPNYDHVHRRRMEYCKKVEAGYRVPNPFGFNF